VSFPNRIELDKKSSASPVTLQKKIDGNSPIIYGMNYSGNTKAGDMIYLRNWVVSALKNKFFLQSVGYYKFYALCENFHFANDKNWENKYV
jgi:hypothetical protein